MRLIQIDTLGNVFFDLEYTDTLYCTLYTVYRLFSGFS